MDFVVVATADWDNPLWTNKQQLASRWGAAGHRVLYIESLGLRRPSLSGRDLGRMGRRLRRANRIRHAGPGVWVCSPLVVPLHRYSLIRAFNRVILTRLVRRAARRIGLTRPVVWTYNPLIHRQLGKIERSALIYHCVDELAGSPGMPADVIERTERELCRIADLVIVTAPGLAEGARTEARRLEYVPNAADFGLFNRATEGLPIAPDLASVPEPRIGFFGAISNYKLDLEMLEAVFRDRPTWQLVMVGPVGGGDPGTSVGTLAQLPNVHLLGPRSRQDLPGYLAGFSACLLPNRINRYTRHMFPLKFFEYLAAGKPTVMTPLPSLEEYSHLAIVAEPTAQGFAGGIAEALAERQDDPSRALRIAEASQHDWDQQALRLEELVREVLPPTDAR